MIICYRYVTNNMLLFSFIEVKAMPFFSSIDFANLLKVEAPFIPQPEDHMDTGYFERK